jgi:hypothetical protein
LKLLRNRPYHARVRLALKAGTCAERLQSAEHLLAEVKADNSNESFLCFTDEKFFRLNGELNLHNMVKWSTTNPSYNVDKGNHYAGVMTFCGVTCKGLIGPFFPEGNTDAAAY